MNLEIVIKKPDRTFTPGEKVRGVVRLTSKGGSKHQGIKLHVDGEVAFQYTGSSNMNIFDVVMNSFKPVKLLDFVIDLAPPDKVPDGVTDIPFEFALNQATKTSLYETYHGVYLSVRYKIHAEMKMGMFARDIKKFVEFVVHNPGQGYDPSWEQQEKKMWTMNPSNLQNVRKALINVVPEYKISGHLDRTKCDLTLPFTGELRVESSAVKIKSIELQLVRVESCSVAEGGMIKEATEIQNLQIADGNIIKNQAIPIFMIFPRLFTCPSLAATNFRVDFEINLIVLFEDGHQVTENFAIHTYRKKTK
jgi:hypothetical protein